MKTKKVVLLVEDDIVDQVTVKRAFREIKIENELHISNNGEEALAYLKDGKNKEAGIILLDLNMPRMNGLEFLSIIKNDAVLKQIPVVILTTSNDRDDKIESFKQSVAGYMLKKVDYPSFLEVMKSFNWYWTLSEFPNG